VQTRSNAGLDLPGTITDAEILKNIFSNSIARSKKELLCKQTFFSAVISRPSSTCCASKMQNEKAKKNEA
jgi:hypothetical protein